MSGSSVVALFQTSVCDTIALIVWIHHDFDYGGCYDVLLIVVLTAVVLQFVLS